jgi:hypothetical protein
LLVCFLCSTTFLFYSPVTRHDDNHHNRNTTWRDDYDHDNMQHTDLDRDDHTTRRDNSDRGDRDHDATQPDDSARNTVRGATPRVHWCALEIGAHVDLKSGIKTTALFPDVLGVAGARISAVLGQS